MTTHLMDASSTDTLTLKWIERATAGFVNAHEMREAMSLALTAGVNLIFSGPGGHGKSEFLTAATAAISDTNSYVKSFGQGTSTEELYGGLDFDALNRASGATIQFNPELSFLTHRIAIFEELFDAPPRVLTSLKDTLTARELRNGHQRFPMVTTMIAAATNHSPQDIAEGGPEIAALIERFPIQLEVKWSSYGEKDFMSLFSAVTASPAETETVTWEDIAWLQQRTCDANLKPSMQRLLARIIVELRNDQVIISPRTAVLAMKLAKAAAVINNRDYVVPRDFMAIAFLPGAQKLRGRISELINEFAASVKGEEELDQLEARLNEAVKLCEETTEFGDFEKLYSNLQSIDMEVACLQLDIRAATRRQELKLQILAAYRLLDQTANQLKAKSLRDEHEARLTSMETDLRVLQRRLRDAKSFPERQSCKDKARALGDEAANMMLHESLESNYSRVRMLVHAIDPVFDSGQ